MRLNSSAVTQHLLQTLRTLNLDHNRIGNEGVKVLIDALTVHKVMYRDQWVRLVRMCHIDPYQQTITSLHLAFNRVDDTGAQYLATELMTNNVRETLWSIFFHDDRQSQTLNSLNLYSNDIGPAGAKALEEALMVNQVRAISGLDLR